MSGVLIFNHHSLPFKSEAEAESSMLEFLKICIACKNIGFNTILVDESIDANWFRLELVKGYYWQDWYNRHNKDENKDILRAFRSIHTSQPLFSMDDVEKDVELLDVEFLGEIDYNALRAACWNHSPISSFPTNELWATSPLAVKLHKLGQDGELECEEDKIVNIYSMEVYEKEKDNFLSSRNELLKKGAELVTNWDGCFPHLQKCGKSEEQLFRWTAGHTIFKQVVSSLTILNSFAESWKIGSIKDYSHESLREFGLNHRVSGESDTVKNNSDLRRTREFYSPMGVKLFFGNHIKISKGYRIHFYPDAETKNILVGYIGKHL